ncbi:hypothetical protein CSPAE12_03673 [Colletotrichum incanum]|nr:hypothetical protein CSPAE12_03673 [Colletotrichum incanum]
MCVVCRVLVCHIWPVVQATISKKDSGVAAEESFFGYNSSAGLYSVAQLHMPKPQYNLCGLRLFQTHPETHLVLQGGIIQVPPSGLDLKKPHCDTGQDGSVGGMENRGKRRLGGSSQKSKQGLGSAIGPPERG